MSGKAERAAKRPRRLSTDSDDQEDEYDWSDRRQRPESVGRTSAARGDNNNRGSGRAAASATSEANMSRARRNVSGNQPAPLAQVSRQPSSSPSSHQSLHLTVKLPASKLRQATGMAPPTRSAKPTISLSSREHFEGGEILLGKRVRSLKKSYVLETDSEEEEEEEDEEMEDVVDDDEQEVGSAEEEDEEEEEEDEEDDDEMADQDAEGEDDDADGDVDMDIPPPPPTIKISRAEKGKKQTISIKPTGKSDGKTVEAKEASNVSDDDEELSELDSEIEEEEEGMQLGNEGDAEGEDEEEEEVDDEEEEEEEDELDSDDETPAGGSRASTPDLTKLTKRQRARLEEGGGGHLLALPDEVQVKKHLTAEEHAMRRAEMARRRKNLSEKRNEEEKMETINKLLKKQAPKTNSRRNAFNGVSGTDASPDGEFPKPNPIFVRWVSNKEGNRIGVPEEWVEGPIGSMFKGEGSLKSSQLVEEVQ